MRVLILGGTGLTGPFAVRRLSELGHAVTIFHRGEHEVDLPDSVRHLHGSLTDPAPELRRLDPAVVVHMRAMTQADAAVFLDLFRRAPRAVVISSCDVYQAYGKLLRRESGPPGPLPLTEDSPLRESRFPYHDDYDKILVEQTLRAQTDLPVTVLRYPAVYGPRDEKRFGSYLKQMAEGAAEIRLPEDFAAWRWTHGFAADVAQAVVLAVTEDRAAGRTYNVGEASTPTWKERVEWLARQEGWRGSVVTAAAEDSPYDYRHHLVVDSSRIRRELGYPE